MDGGIDALLEKAVTQVAGIDAESAENKLKFLRYTQFSRSMWRG